MTYDSEHCLRLCSETVLKCQSLDGQVINGALNNFLYLPEAALVLLHLKRSPMIKKSPGLVELLLKLDLPL